MIKTSLVIKTLSNQTPYQNDHPKKSKKPPSSPSNGGDHAGEIDLAIEDNALAWLHLFMITMMIVMIVMTVVVMMLSLMTVMKQMITVMLYIRSGSIWGSPQVLTAKNCFPFILSFVMIIVIISPSYHISLSFVLVIPPIQWSSGCNANKKSY